MPGTRGNHHVVDVMERRLKEMPHLLHSSAARISCCIFRVPQSLVDINLKAYYPQIVSIGPYHHGKDHLQMIEEHKWRFLDSLLSRTKSNGRSLKAYFKAVKSMEERARASYSGDIESDKDKFVEMLVLDGCFIIEIFRIVGGLVVPHNEDPIVNTQWILSFLMRDLFKLENQIPFFVLQCLFDLSKEKDDPSLSILALTFLNMGFQRPDEVIERYDNLDALHLLDLLLSSLIPTDQESPRPYSSPKAVHCATKLRQNGIKFEQVKSDTILDVKFRKGVILMPNVSVDGFSTFIFLNCIAFEQSHGRGSMHVSAYAILLGSLMNTAKDVELLRDRDIIENRYGTDEEVATFFNDLGKDVSVDIEESYLSNLFQDVNEYSRKTWRLQYASFRHTYFDTTWSFLSALAAVILLLLTTAQTFFAIYSYFHPK